MVEDTPQELVHDLVTEAVFGDHPLGRPVLGSADVIASVSRALARAYHRAALPARQHRRRRGRAASTTTVSSRLVGPAARRRPRDRPRRRRARAAARRAAAAGARLPAARTTEQYHVCLGAPGHRALGPPPLHGVRPRRRSSAARPRRASSRRSARSAASPTPSTRFASQYADTGQIGVYVGTREENLAECLRDRRAEQIGDISERRRRGDDELERAKENLKGRDHALHGVDVEPDEPARQVADHGQRAARPRPDPRRDRGGGRGRGRRSSPACCSRRSACRSPGSGRARSASSRPSSASIPRSSWPRRPTPVTGPPARRGREGRVACSRRGSRRPGTRSAGSARGSDRARRARRRRRLHGARRRAGNVAALPGGRRAVQWSGRRGSRRRASSSSTRSRASAASPASWPRTSRSAPC